MNKILVISASPAIQQTLVLRDFTARRVNRATQHYLSLAGKGVNAARVAASLGGEVLLVTALDPSTLERIRGDARSWGVEIKAVETIAVTRTCTTLLGPESVHGTELVQESPSLTAEESARFQELAIAESSMLTQEDILVLTGSIPVGVPATLYRDLARSTRARVIIDAHSDPLRFALEAIEHVSWLKPNLEEWNALSRSMGAVDPLTSAQALSTSLRFLLTDGPRPATILGPSGVRWNLAAAQITVANPIGSGDAVTGGLAYAVACSLPDSDAARLALACGAADCETLEPGLVEPARVQEILKTLSIDVLL